MLDFSKVLAGPLCAQYLGDMGADVIKIEKPGRGDSIRYADRTGRLPPEIGGLNFQAAFATAELAARDAARDA